MKVWEVRFQDRKGVHRTDHHVLAESIDEALRLARKLQGSEEYTDFDIVRVDALFSIDVAETKYPHWKKDGEKA
jgi:hypothetical protein